MGTEEGIPAGDAPTIVELSADDVLRARNQAVAEAGIGRNAEHLLEVRGLSTHFFTPDGIVQAVDDVSFDVGYGETLGLVGESGCGKSTTARLLLRLMDPTAGSIAFNGREIADIKGAELKALRREMQMIFQDPYSSLNPRRTVGAIIGEPFRIHNMNTGDGERKRAVQELMDTVGLNPE
ncbi:MAG: ATP-binding cassette domain-containing protein, partial [Chloroflexota bacterium]